MPLRRLSYENDLSLLMYESGFDVGYKADLTPVTLPSRRTTIFVIVWLPLQSHVSVIQGHLEGQESHGGDVTAEPKGNMLPFSFSIKVPSSVK